MGVSLLAEGLLLLVFLVSHTVIGAFIRPDRHTLPTGLQSLSGSDQNGGCPNPADMTLDCVMNGICDCTTGNVKTTSALIDGDYPSGVIDTTETNWASNFFTINRNNDSLTNIGFQWDMGFELQGVELKLFNCPSERIAIHIIKVYATVSYTSFTPLKSPPGLVGTYITTVNDRDCTGLTTIVIPTTPITAFSVRDYFLEFSFPEGDSNTGIYIAEVRFSDTNITAPTEVSSTPPLPPASSTVQQAAPSSSTTSPSTTVNRPSPSPSMSIVSVSTTRSRLTNLTASSVVAPSTSMLPTVSTNSTASSSMPSTTDSSVSLPPTTSIPSVMTSSTTVTLTITSPSAPMTTTQTSTTPSTASSPPPAATDSNTRPDLGVIVGPLVGVIIVLVLVIAIGVVIVAVWLTRSRGKRDFDVQPGPSTGSNGGTIEMDAFRRSFANNQYYEDSRHIHDHGGVPLGGGYFEIGVDETTEPVYHSVINGKSQVESVENKETEEGFYADVKETIESTSQLPPYSQVKIEAPPVPQKTPELMRVLTLEREQADGKANVPPLIVTDENEEEVETIENHGDSESAYQVVGNVDKSASVHSGLAVLTKPVFENMEPNPEYDTPDIVRHKMAEPTDLIYTNPDAMDKEPSSESIYLDPDAPSKPAQPITTTTNKDAEEIYTDIDKDSPPLKQAASHTQLDGELIYTDPNPPAKPKRTHSTELLRQQDPEDFYTDIDKESASAPSKPPASTSEVDAELIYYSNPNEVTKSAKHLATTGMVYPNEDAISSEAAASGEGIYCDPDRENIAEMLPAIYESVFQEGTVAAIFDPDSIPPVYENMKSDEELFPYPPIYADVPAPGIAPLELTADSMRPVKVLGSGCFGQVVLAETVGLSRKDLKMSKTDDDKTKSIQVAIKTLKATASSTTRESFEKEYKFMSKLNHPHVIRLLGVCKESTPYIMMEYLKHGDLNQYLEENFDTIVDLESENPVEISVKTLVSMCKQISDAMKYLASHNCIHRDLAARNCLVGKSNIVKLSDFGMSRSLYESHYYIIKGRAVLPVRWMSSECFSGKFSVNSDIWAFGVTMWEIFTLAKVLPYEDLSDAEVAQDARKGPSRMLLTRPKSCPQEVFDIMKKCWAFEPNARAPFHELFSDLSSLTEISDDDCV